MRLQMYSLRSLNENDLVWFLAIRNESRMQLHDPRWFSIHETEEWWAGQDRQNFKVIEFGGVPIGYFRLGGVQKRHSLNLLQIGCDIDSNFRRQGHAYRVYQAYLPTFLEEYNVDGFILRVLPTNRVAQILYRKLVFRTSRLSLTDDEDLRTTKINDIEMWLAPAHTTYDFIDLLLAASSQND